MNKRLLLLSVGSGILIAACMAVLLSPLTKTFSFHNQGVLYVISVIPCLFGLCVGCHALSDIFPTLFFQKYRSKKRMASLMKNFGNFIKMSNGYSGPLEGLLSDEVGFKNVIAFIKEIEAPLRSYHFDCMEAKTIKDFEVSAISSIVKAITLLQTSSDPHAHIEAYLKEIKKNGYEDEAWSYSRHISYSIEESLAYAIIFLFKAVARLGISPSSTRWPVYIMPLSKGNLQENLKSILAWIAAPGQCSDEKMSELYLTSALNIVAACRDEYIPISFYVMKALEKSQ